MTPQKKVMYVPVCFLILKCKQMKVSTHTCTTCMCLHQLICKQNLLKMRGITPRAKQLEMLHVIICLLHCMELWVSYYASMLISEMDDTSPIFLNKMPQDIPFRVFLTQRVNNTSAKTIVYNLCYNVAAPQRTYHSV